MYEINWVHVLAWQAVTLGALLILCWVLGDTRAQRVRLAGVAIMACSSIVLGAVSVAGMFGWVGLR